MRLKLDDALSSLPQTQAELAKIPPRFIVATGLDDDVMVLLLHIGDSGTTAAILVGYISLSESHEVISGFKGNSRLIRKRFDIKTAQQLKSELRVAGTHVEFVRPLSD